MERAFWNDIEGMYDYRKADAQKWLNSTYSGRSGFVPVKEDGISAGTLLFKGFVRALQFEIGLEKLGEAEANGNFGPATFRNCLGRVPPRRLPLPPAKMTAIFIIISIYLKSNKSIIPSFIG